MRCASCYAASPEHAGQHQQMLRHVQRVTDVRGVGVQAAQQGAHPTLLVVVRGAADTRRGGGGGGGETAVRGGKCKQCTRRVDKCKHGI